VKSRLISFMSVRVSVNGLYFGGVGRSAKVLL
jgi:hypothetical protein